MGIKRMAGAAGAAGIAGPGGFLYHEQSDHRQTGPPGTLPGAAFFRPGAARTDTAETGAASHRALISSDGP